MPKLSAKDKRRILLGYLLDEKGRHTLVTTLRRAATFRLRRGFLKGARWKITWAEGRHWIVRYLQEMFEGFQPNELIVERVAVVRAVDWVAVVREGLNLDGEGLADELSAEMILGTLGWRGPELTLGCEPRVTPAPDFRPSSFEKNLNKGLDVASD